MHSLFFSVIAFFPFWMQLWEAHPLTSQEVSPQNTPYLSEHDEKMLPHVLSCRDATMRRRIYAALAKSGCNQARDILLQKCLPQEQEPLLKASIIRYLAQMETAGIAANEISAYLNEPSPDVVVEAIHLYSLLEDASPKKIAPFLKEEQAYALRLAAWRAFSHDSARADTLKKRPFALQNEPDAVLRNLALQVVLVQSSRGAEARKWMAEAIKLDDESRVLLAQHPAKLDNGMRQQLFSNPNPVIRCALCASPDMVIDEKLLVMALNDKSEAVRSAALNTMAKLPSVQGETLAGVLRAFGDASAPVRWQAESTFIALAPLQRDKAVQLLSDAVGYEQPNEVRLHSIHCIRKLAMSELASHIAKNFSEADAAEIIAASLEALAELCEKGAFPSVIMAYHDHSSALVRQMSLRAMGKLQLPGAAKLVISAAETDKNVQVRAEAFEAMGRAPDSLYLSCLVNCLVQTGRTSTIERANAAWALGKNIPAENADITPMRKAADRLRTQCTTAVIPDFVPMFDGVEVIANAICTLAVLARRTGDTHIIRDFQAVVELYDVPAENLQELEDGKIPRTEVTCSISHQAYLWKNGKKITTQPLPCKRIELPFESIKNSAK